MYIFEKRKNCARLYYGGVYGVDCNVMDNITRRGIVQLPLKYLNKNTNDEMSTMTFDSLMEFVGADYAVAA